MVFVETSAFTARIAGQLSHEQYRLLQIALLEDPGAGDLIPGTGGLRKLRWAGSGRGKRGGTRVIYFWHPPSDRILFLFAYLKNERADLTSVEKAALRKVIQTEYP